MSGGPEIGKGPPLIFRALAVCVLRHLLPRGSLPSVARYVSGADIFNTFPIFGAKVQHFFDMIKFFCRKMTKYVVKHKKRGILHKKREAPLSGRFSFFFS